MTNKLIKHMEFEDVKLIVNENDNIEYNLVIEYVKNNINNKDKNCIFLKGKLIMKDEDKEGNDIVKKLYLKK